eukprot:13858348-Alexandrium_andersonii.AAC.1
MSASLVGSEMCIRDRRSTVSMCVDRRPVYNRSRFQRYTQFAAGSSSFGAVSYTHLTLPTICSV